MLHLESNYLALGPVLGTLFRSVSSHAVLSTSLQCHVARMPTQLTLHKRRARGLL